MSNMRFRGVMEYTGYPERYGVSWKSVEPVMAQLYVMAYNRYANNFEFGPVNEEWETLNPDIRAMDEGSKEWKDYNRFVADKATAWVEEHINKEMMSNLTTRFYVDDDEVVFTGYDIMHPECRMSMHLESF